MNLKLVSLLLQIMQIGSHYVKKNYTLIPINFFSFKFYKLVSIFLYLKLIPMSKYFSKNLKNKKSDFLFLIQNKFKN